MNPASVLSCKLTDSQTAMWYLGQVGMLFKYDGHFIAVDPYLSDYVDRFCCRDGIVWKRLYDPPMDPEALNFLDAVICTHAHGDHADPITLAAVAKANPDTVFIVPAPVAAQIASYGIPTERIIPARADRHISVAGFDICPVPSAHEELHPDENGDYHELGYVIETGAGRFFHAGDMCPYDGLAKRLQNIDMAFLPINGRDYYRLKNNIIGNFTCEEAVILAREIGADILVPVHHDLYEINRVDASNFLRAVSAHDPMRKFHLFAPGERYIFAKD